MPNAKVKLNHGGMADLLKSAGVVGDLHRRMESVAASARASAPVETGAYRASIAVQDETHPSRAVSRVVASAPHAGLVESRTGNLARALDAAGGA